MDAFIELAREAGSTQSTTTLRDRASVQGVVGEVEGIISGARAHALDALDKVWQAVSRGDPDPTQEIAQARLAITHSSRQAVKAVDMLFHAAGTNAIFRKHSLERSFRDVHVAIQHLAGHTSHFEVGGRVMLGLPAGDIGW
jgi:alkylation response protein AidB-like acyl-CoA dehydrogenase